MLFAVLSFGMQERDFVAALRQHFGKRNLSGSGIGMRPFASYIMRNNANRDGPLGLWGHRHNRENASPEADLLGRGVFQSFQQWPENIAEAAPLGQRFKSVFDNPFRFFPSRRRADIVLNALCQLIQGSFHKINIRPERRRNAAGLSNDQRALGNSQQNYAMPFEVLICAVVDVQQHFASLRQTDSRLRVHLGCLTRNHWAHRCGPVKKALELPQSLGVGRKEPFPTSRRKP